MADQRPDRMTVGELREALAGFDQDLPVLVDGYEGGMDYPYAPVVVNVFERNSAWYYGRFEDDPYGPEEKAKPMFEAVRLPR
jgi:hypothetical protein